MSVKKDGSGRRSVQVETEAPGTPEEVWRAMATGPGIGSWFVPTTFETDEHGRPVRAVSDFGSHDSSRRQMPPQEPAGRHDSARAASPGL